jgi:uncharacterized protein (DUF433 family)
MPEERPYPHITLSPRGVPCLDGTRHRVIDLVADHVAHGYSAAHIVEQYPDLTPAHIYAALAYYDDHQEAMDAALIASDAQAAHQCQRHAPHPTLVAARARQAGSCCGRPLRCARRPTLRSFSSRAAPVAKAACAPMPGVQCWIGMRPPSRGLTLPRTCVRCFSSCTRAAAISPRASWLGV